MTGEEEKEGAQGVGAWAPVSVNQGQEMETELLCERKSGGGGGREERTWVGVGCASCQHAQKEEGEMRSMVVGCGECWRLEAVISKPALLSRWTQLWTRCLPKDVPTAPRGLRPSSNSYLFIY